MDNDVRNTEYCIGFSTAINRATEAIERQRTTVGSHERIGIFRVFGRDAGYTALYTAYVSSMRCCIPEYKVDLKKLFDLLMADKRNNPSNYALVLLSEGADWEGHELKETGEADAFGHRKKENIAEALSDEIKKALGEETIVSDLTYDASQRQARFRRQDGRLHLRRHGRRLHRGEQVGLMMAITHGCYAAVRFPIRSSGRARSTWRRCTTSSATGRPTPTKWACRSS